TEEQATTTIRPASAVRVPAGNMDKRLPATRLRFAAVADSGTNTGVLAAPFTLCAAVNTLVPAPGAVVPVSIVTAAVTAPAFVAAVCHPIHTEVMTRSRFAKPKLCVAIDPFA